MCGKAEVLDHLCQIGSRKSRCSRVASSSQSTMSVFRYHFVSRTLALRPSVLSVRHLSSMSVRRKDPWSMPHTPEHIASTTSPANMPPPKPLPRLGESIETTRSRLVYQSRKRGTLECDLLLSTFAQENLGTMDAKELSEFDKVRSISSPSQYKRVFLYSSAVSCSNSFFFSFSSLWMNRIGIFIIGLRKNGRRLSDGRARGCLKS
jgi:hypothetical protein